MEYSVLEELSKNEKCSYIIQPFWNVNFCMSQAVLCSIDNRKMKEAYQHKTQNASSHACRIILQQELES